MDDSDLDNLDALVALADRLAGDDTTPPDLAAAAGIAGRALRYLLDVALDAVMRDDRATGLV